MISRICLLVPILAGAAILPPRPALAAGKPSAKNSTISGSALVDTSEHHFREGHPAIFMAWGAPWGMPGAREAANWSCTDTLAADTLYLTFDPGEDISVLMGIDLALLFHAAPGDSLGPFWDLSRKGVNPWNLRIEFDPPPDGTQTPWPVPGMGMPRYTLQGGTGRLDLTYYVPASQGGPIVAGTRYFAARIMLRLRKGWLKGCLQPVCVDFDHLLVSHTDGSRWINSGQRFTSWNSPGGAVCTEFRKRPPSEEPPRFGGRSDLKAAPGETTPTVRDTTRR